MNYVKLFKPHWLYCLKVKIEMRYVWTKHSIKDWFVWNIKFSKIKRQSIKDAVQYSLGNPTKINESILVGKL